MFVVTFPAGTMSDELGATYGLCNPLNGIFSPDGDHLAVMATQRTGSCGATDRSQFDVYVLDLTTPGQKQQVTQNDVPDEDPQFSPAGDFILFKHNGHLAQWAMGSLPFTTCATLTPGSFCFNAPTGEQSKPVMTTGFSPLQVCYYESSGASADIYCFDLQEGLAGADITVSHTTAVAHSGISDSRPLIDMPFLYYVRWRDPANNKDFVARKQMSDLASGGETAAFCTDTGADYTDPCPLPGDVLVVSSDATGIGRHDLFIAPFQSTSMVTLDRLVSPSIAINTNLEELGASFWRAR
jgi:dipeptidyl aminopeptidase/acylaminoacyl peptidase